MNHSWMLNGVNCNFCTKCGIRKSRSYYATCHMHNSSVKRNTEHRLTVSLDDYGISFKKKYNAHNEDFYEEIKVCSACEISNRRWDNYCIDFSKKDRYAYVTYLSDQGKNNKKKYVFFDSSYKRHPIDRSGNPIQLNYLKIYCPYNEEELMIKDIIL